MQRFWQRSFGRLGGCVAVILVGAVTMGCGSSAEWEPAKLPSEMLVAPPNVPGEGKSAADELADAFDDIEGMDEGDSEAAPEEPAPAEPTPDEGSGEAPAGEAPDAAKAPATGGSAPEAPAAKAPSKGLPDDL